MAPRRFIRSELATAALVLCLTTPVAAQSLLDRVQGLYYPPNQGSWDCATLGMDGGAVGIRGDTLTAWKAPASSPTLSRSRAWTR
jgi:hypothetical protein